jgi:hypothetical protein
MPGNQELEHRSPRQVDDRTPLQTTLVTVPILKEVKEGSVSAHRGSEQITVAFPETVAKDLVLEPRFPEHGGYQIFVFQHSKLGFVPVRIAAVVPDGLTEFTRALIFFHPLPTKKAGYDDAQYRAQTGGWHNIYRYCDQQGVQLGASKRKMVLIFPIFNLASVDTCGGFPAEWKNLVELIMKLIRNSRFPGRAKEKLVVEEVITASYSAGIQYMHTFLTKATNLKAHLKEVWDYDGRFSTAARFSESAAAFGVGAGAKVLTYDQRPVKIVKDRKGKITSVNGVDSDFKVGKGIHIPDERWRDLPDNRSSFLRLTPTDVEVVGGGSLVVHGAFPQFIMFPSLSLSDVGK